MNTAPPCARGAAGAAQPGAARGSIRVLVVEDEMLIAEEICERLRELGMQVFGVAGRGERAIEMVARDAPDLVLMDVRLAGRLDGVQTAAMIWERFGTPVIFLTAHSDADTIDRAQASAPYGYLIKPVDPRALHAAISVAVHKHQLEQRLRESEERFSLALAQVNEGVLVTDADGGITFMNAAAEVLTGGRFPQACGQAVRSVLCASDPSTNEDLVELIGRTALGSGASLSRPFMRMSSADGAARWVSVSAAAVRDRQERVRGAVIVLRDVSDLQRASASLDRVERRLKQAETLEALGRVAGGVAHDFNNVITAVMGYAGVLRLKLPADDEKQAIIKEMQLAAQRAANITHDLLTFSRQDLTTPRALNLNELVERITRMLSRLLGADVEVRTELAPNLRSIKADATQIERVLVNLATNARDAMPDGGLLTIATRNCDVAASSSEWPATPPGAYVSLRVADTGKGMDAATLARAFEPFFTTKEVGSGTGLGLAMVHGAITQAGGYVHVQSEPGEGAHFTILLPASEEPVVQSAIAGTAEAPGGEETILLVDDDYFVREVTRASLEAGGYTVVAAENGREALAVLQERAASIDLVVSDVVMPEMGGRVLSERIAESWPGLRVLLMSGYNDDEMLRRGVRNADLFFMQKPFTPQQLLSKVRELLDVQESEAARPT